MGKPKLAWKKDVTLDSGIVVEDAVRSIVRFEFDEVRQFCTMFWEGWVSEAVFDAQGPDEPSMSGSFTFDDGPLTIVVDAETIGPAIFTTHVLPGISSAGLVNKFRPLVTWYFDLGADPDWVT